MKRVFYLIIACIVLWLIFGHREEKEKPIPQTKTIQTKPAEKSVPKLSYRKTPYPFVIEPDSKKICIYDKGSSRITVIEKGKAHPINAKKTAKRLSRYGIEDTLCYRLAGKRFICISRDAAYREASFRIDCDVLIIAKQVTETTYPESLKGFLKKWIESWEKAKDNFAHYQSLYAEDFKNRYGDKKKWMDMRKKELSKTKYIDILVDNVSMFIIPNSSLYVILFDQTYRSNLRRIDSRKALVLKIENNKPLIVSEVVL